MQISFTGNRNPISAVSDGVPGRSGRIQLAWNTNNYIFFNSNNDYSYMAASAMTENPLITMHYNDELIWGEEP
jgi:hypothetical protein